MCGINGILSYNNSVDYTDNLRKMNSFLANRGPDNEGEYFDNRISLGHRRLSIIDLSEAGNQPFICNENRYVIVYNGEVYNFNEIKQQLKDYPFRSSTDTEVILAAYKKWGEACVDKFNGMFAFAIWDKQNNELFIARDRLGIKPLYFYKSDKLFIFSSAIRSILNSGLVSKLINNSALSDYLRYQTVHSPYTVVKDLYMLKAGNTITINEKQFTINEYWRASQNYDNQAKYLSYNDVKSKVYTLLSDAVEKRLVADVPFGAFLSGGIDSSIITALMSRASSQPVNTFSVTFEEEQFSEAKYARIIANKFNTNHTVIKLTANDFLDYLPEALNAMEHPGGDGPNTYVVSKVTRQAGITMALSGLGGDELFAGYDIFSQTTKLLKYNKFSKLPYNIKLLISNILRRLKPSVSTNKIAELLKLDNWNIENTYPLRRQVLLDSEIEKLFSDKDLKSNRVGEMIKKYQNKKLPILSQVSNAELITYLTDVLLRDTDQMSMASSLEVRVPFLDHNLVEFVLGVSDAHKYPVTPKKLLVDSMGDLLPDEIVNRPKMGFVLPWNKWLKEELRGFCESKLKQLVLRDNFSEIEINSMWKRFLKSDPTISWSRIWYLVVLENWLGKEGLI